MGKWLLEMVIGHSTTALSSKTCTNPQIKDNEQGHELTLIRPQSQH
jgi:hypothetical protein